MTYNEKKSLYESIMKDVAKTVKRKINEDFLPGDSDFYEKTEEEERQDLIERIDYNIRRIKEHLSDIGNVKKEHFDIVEKSFKKVSMINSLCLTVDNDYNDYSYDELRRMDFIIHAAEHAAKLDDNKFQNLVKYLSSITGKKFEFNENSMVI